MPQGKANYYIINKIYGTRRNVKIMRYKNVYKSDMAEPKGNENGTQSVEKCKNLHKIFGNDQDLKS